MVAQRATWAPKYPEALFRIPCVHERVNGQVAAKVHGSASALAGAAPTQHRPAVAQFELGLCSELRLNAGKQRIRPCPSCACGSRSAGEHDLGTGSSPNLSSMQLSIRKYGFFRPSKLCNCGSKLWHCNSISPPSAWRVELEKAKASQSTCSCKADSNSNMILTFVAVFTVVMIIARPMHGRARNKIPTKGSCCTGNALLGPKGSHARVGFLTRTCREIVQADSKALIRPGHRL